MVTILGDSKYVFATFRGAIKVVYEIYDWFPASTQ